MCLAALSGWLGLKRLWAGGAGGILCSGCSVHGGHPGRMAEYEEVVVGQGPEGSLHSGCLGNWRGNRGQAGSVPVRAVLCCCCLGGMAGTQLGSGGGPPAGVGVRTAGAYVGLWAQVLLKWQAG